MKKERIPYIDLGAGIMILWMIIFHALGQAYCMELYDLWDVMDLSLLPEGTHAYINAEGRVAPLSAVVVFPYLHFFMPWFFYKSGQFFKKREKGSLLHKDSNKLLRQFVIWSVIGYMVFLCFCYAEGNFTFRQVIYRVARCLFLEGYIMLNVPLWFLLTLFGVRQVANIVLPKKEGDKFYWLRCLTIILLGYTISYFAFRLDHRLLPQWIANGASGLAFFTMGYCLQKYETKWWLILPCVFAYIASCIWGFPIVGMKDNFLHSGIYLLNMPACFAGIVVFNVICRYVARYLRVLSLPFEYIGKYAMIIYVSHGILYTSVGKILTNYELTTLMPYTLWLILGSYIIFLPLFCYLSKKIHI